MSILSCLFLAITLVSTMTAEVVPQSPTGRPAPTHPLVFGPPEKYIAGTPQMRLNALRNLKTEEAADRGRWVIAYFSINCRDCDRAARALNAYSSAERIIGLAAAPAEDVQRWSKGLGLKYPVLAVDDDTLEKLGAIVYPTLVLFVDGKATGARCPSMEQAR